MVYLDYNATTPIDPSVAETMLPFINTHFGNPSSNHQFGNAARQGVENARLQVADMLGCSADEIYFTSGGTESNNLAIKGYAFANRNKGNHIITSAVEHPAVLEVCKFLESKNFELTILPVDKNGFVDFKGLKNAIRDSTILISIMHANNEVGTIQPIKEIAEIAHSHNIALHTDAAQSIGKINVDVSALDVEMLSIAGHKLYAPKGVGALYIRRGVLLEKQSHGANHERNLRPGTENVLEIVGLGKACEMVKCNIDKYAVYLKEMRDLLEREIRKVLPNVKINGDLQQRLPNTSSVSFPGIAANEVLSRVGNIAASAGAACHAENVNISHVLSAMHVPLEYAKGTLRFSTGRMTTKNEIMEAVAQITKAVIYLNSCN